MAGELAWGWDCRGRHGLCRERAPCGKRWRRRKRTSRRAWGRPWGVGSGAVTKGRGVVSAAWQRCHDTTQQCTARQAGRVHKDLAGDSYAFRSPTLPAASCCMCCAPVIHLTRLVSRRAGQGEGCQAAALPDRPVQEVCTVVRVYVPNDDSPLLISSRMDLHPCQEAWAASPPRGGVGWGPMPPVQQVRPPTTHCCMYDNNQPRATLWTLCTAVRVPERDVFLTSCQRTYTCQTQQNNVRNQAILQNKTQTRPLKKECSSHWWCGSLDSQRGRPSLCV